MALPFSRRDRGDLALAAVALAGLAVGFVFSLTSIPWLAGPSWTIATVPVLVGLLIQIVRSLRAGDVGLDIVAALSMSAALAFGEPLAANVVALMYAGGQLLEAYAQGRARTEMTALLGRVPRTAMRYGSAGLSEVPIGSIVPGDRLLIREGEVLPVDGTVAGSAALLDMSALTGESRPEPVLVGQEAMSGTTSIGPAFDIVATRPAAESTYARIVRLVEDAERRKAPMVRLADRYAVIFLVLTVALAAAAWILSGEPVRALAVLVVATPCPLILAVPVALISGISRAAKSGVLFKDGRAIEAIARVRTAIFDKTGTLTHGRPSVVLVRPLGDLPEAEILRLAASLDLASGHVVAAALVAEAAERMLRLSPPASVDETPGSGLAGTVDGHRVLVGSPGYIEANGVSFPAAAKEDDALLVGVAVDGMPAGLIALADPVRTDAALALRQFREAGLNKIILASGDRRNVAAAVGRELGVDDAFGELTPSQKVDLVTREAAIAPVMMIGDGVNDAPALAAADVGVALGARGAAASSEAAGIVLLVDALAPLVLAVRIGRRTRQIAVQSVLFGLGLSIAAMVVAAFGYLPPVQGALLQEAIDIAVILNALRALR